MYFVHRLVWLVACLHCCMLSSQAQTNIADSLCHQQHCFCENHHDPAGIMFSRVHHKNEWMIAYRLMQSKMDGINENKTTLLDNKIIPKMMLMRMHMLMGMIGVSDRLTLMLMGGFQNSYMEMVMPSGHRHPMSTQGIIDTKLFGIYAIKTKKNYTITGSLGISFPNGKINLKGEVNSMMYPGERMPYMMQTGSGSLGLIPGCTLFIRRNKFQAGEKIESNFWLNKNYLHYQLGNSVTANSWCSFESIKKISHSLRVEASMANAIKGADTQFLNNNDLTAMNQNYGGILIYAFIGTNVGNFTRKHFNYRLSVEYGFPLYQNLNGIQMLNKQNLFIQFTSNF